MTTTKTLGTVLQEQNFREQMRNVMEAVTADSVKAKLYETAETIEEYYEIFKDCCIVKFEQFKSLCEEIVDYFNQPKVELDDELMEIISGGNIFKKIGNWCKKNWKASSRFLPAALPIPYRSPLRTNRRTICPP